MHRLLLGPIGFTFGSLSEQELSDQAFQYDGRLGQRYFVPGVEFLFICARLKANVDLAEKS